MYINVQNWNHLCWWISAIYPNGQKEWFRVLPSIYYYKKYWYILALHDRNSDEGTSTIERGSQKCVLHNTLMTYTWTYPTYFSYQSPLSQIFHSNQKILPKITHSWTIFLYNRSQTDVHFWLVVSSKPHRKSSKYRISSNVFTCLASMYNINFE